jgi:3-methyladenine DNA glycosylase AlkD
MPDPLAALEDLADPVRAAEMAAYHKAPRRYLGIAAPEVYALADRWRAQASVAERVALAARLWDSDIHEARMAAARLLTQARIREDEQLVWAEFLRWVPGFDGWALADHACKVGERRLVHDPARLDTVETWLADPSLWTRRAALVVTLPWTKLTHPAPDERARRERILGWAASLVPDRDWFIQKAIGWWLRSLAKRDPARVETFLAEHGPAMRAFARREAARGLPRGAAGGPPTDAT